MKKILCLTLLLVSIAGSAFAAHTLVSSASVTATAATLYAGTTQESLNTAVNSTAKFSTGVAGCPIYGANGYSINTKHTSGSKVFGTANDATNVYWKASPSKVVLGGTAADLANGVIGDAMYNNATNGWTSY